MTLDLGALYTAHISELVGWLVRRVDCRETAEELAADAFVRLARHADRYGPGHDEGRSLVFAVARTVLKDHYRTLGRRPQAVPLDDAGALRLAASPEGATDLDLAAAVARLTPLQQRVIRERFWEDMPHERVAARMGRSVEATKKIQHRALHRLAVMLARPPGPGPGMDALIGATLRGDGLRRRRSA